MSRQNCRRDSGSTPPVGSSRKRIARLVENRAAEREALTPAAREVARELPLAALQSGHLQHERRARRSRASRSRPYSAGEELDVLIDGQQLVERELLRHVADAPLHRFGIAARRRCRRRVAVPDVGASRPHSMRMVVDLPAPLLPRKPKISPGRTSNDTSSTATKSPKRRVRCETSMASHLLDPANVPRRWRGSGQWTGLTPAATDNRDAHRPRARSRRARAIWTLASVRVRSSSACSSATCASSRSTLVATPAVKRSLTTRRASAALRTPSVAATTAATRRFEVQPALRDLECSRLSNSASRARSARSTAAASAFSARARPPSQSDQLSVDAHVPRVVGGRAARHDARVGTGEVVAAGDRNRRPPPRCRRHARRLRLGASISARRSGPRRTAPREALRVLSTPSAGLSASGRRRDVARHRASAIGLDRGAWCLDADQPTQVGFDDRPRIARLDEQHLLPRALRLDGQHVVGRHEPGTSWARTASRCASSRLTDSSHDPHRSRRRSRATRTSRATSSRRSARATATILRARLPFGARPRAPAHRRARTCRSATARRAACGSCPGISGNSTLRSPVGVTTANSGTWLVRV